MIRRTRLQRPSSLSPLESLFFPTTTLERERKRKRRAEEEPT